MKRCITIVGSAIFLAFLSACVPPDMFQSWTKVYLANDSDVTLFHEWPEQEEISEESLKIPGLIAPGERKLVGEDRQKRWISIDRYVLRVRMDDSSGALVKDYDIPAEWTDKSGLVDSLPDEDGKTVYLVHVNQALVDAAGETP